MAAPKPSARTFAILGQQPNAPTEACVIAHGHIERLYDPRAWPGGDQRWAIAMQGEADEALALIVDAERWAGAA